MNQEVTDYIQASPANQQEILTLLRDLVHETTPEVKEEFKWGRPVFRTAKDFAYLKVAKAYVTLGFFDAGKLSDPKNLLEGTGKGMRHIKIRDSKSLDKKLIRDWLKAATK